MSDYLKYFFNSRFGLVIHGDTPSTSRLYDSIASGSIPIILSNQIQREALPFYDKINYAGFSYFIDEEQEIEKIISQIYVITQLTSLSELRIKFENLLRVQKEVLWRKSPNLLAENILRV